MKRNTELLSLIEASITERNVLSLTYISASGNRSDRDIEPLALYFTQDRWMLIAFCKMRKGWRAFRLDAVVGIEKTLETFPPNQFELSDYFARP